MIIVTQRSRLSQLAQVRYVVYGLPMSYFYFSAIEILIMPLNLPEFVDHH